MGDTASLPAIAPTRGADVKYASPCVMRGDCRSPWLPCRDAAVRVCFQPKRYARATLFIIHPPPPPPPPPRPARRRIDVEIKLSAATVTSCATLSRRRRRHYYYFTVCGPFEPARPVSAERALCLCLCRGQGPERNNEPFSSPSGTIRNSNVWIRQCSRCAMTTTEGVTFRGCRVSVMR